MKFLSIILLGFIINFSSAQSVKVKSNGDLKIRCNHAYQGVRIKNSPAGFILAKKEGFITKGYKYSEIFEHLGSDEKEISIDLVEIKKIDDNYKSKKIAFVKFIDSSGKVPNKSITNNYGTYTYPAKIKFDDPDLLNDVNLHLKSFGFNSTAAGKSVFKEKTKIPDYAIAGDILHFEKETKGTAGFKISIRVDWSIYDIENEEVIYSFTSEGYSDSRIAHSMQKEMILALKDAANGLFVTSDFQTKISANAIRKGDNLDSLEIFLPIIPSKESLTYGETIKNSINSVVTVKTDFGHGSGFIISEDGFCITNYHVIKDSESIDIILNNKLRLPAKLILSNRDRDVALLQIVGSGHSALPVKLNSIEENIGSEAIAIGTPEKINLGQTVTKGIISGYRTIEEKKYIQTDVSINSGNSGGALINSEGKVIGVVVAKIIGENIEGLGFAIPINAAIKALNIKFIEK